MTKRHAREPFPPMRIGVFASFSTAPSKSVSLVCSAQRKSRKKKKIIKSNIHLRYHCDIRGNVSTGLKGQSSWGHKVGHYHIVEVRMHCAQLAGLAEHIIVVIPLYMSKGATKCSFIKDIFKACGDSHSCLQMQVNRSAGTNGDGEDTFQ